LLKKVKFQIVEILVSIPCFRDEKFVWARVGSWLKEKGASLIQGGWVKEKENARGKN
jgi:hypothetical protein